MPRGRGRRRASTSSSGGSSPRSNIATCKRRPVRRVLVHQRARHRLDDVMDVHRHTAGVRPEADVDLFRLDELVDDGGRTVKERSDLRRLLTGERGDASDVTLGLDDQRPDPERPDAVLDEPVLGLANDPAGQRNPPAARSQPRHPPLRSTLALGGALPRRRCAFAEAPTLHLQMDTRAKRACPGFRESAKDSPRNQNEPAKGGLVRS